MQFLNSILGSFAKSLSHNNRVIGVDVGSSSIKVVEIEDREGILTLTTYGEVQLGPYVDKPVGYAVKLEANQEQEALVDVLRESASQAEQAVFSMPLSSSFVTNVSITLPDEETDLASMVRVEARKVIPASLNEITLDWAEVEVGTTDAEESTVVRNVLIAAIQNNALERFKVLMQFAGLPQPPTEIECFSAVRALFNTDETHIAIIDLGAQSAKLYLARKGLLMRMHRVRAGGAVATAAIAKALEIAFAEAEDKKLHVQRSDAEFSKLQQIHHESYDRAFREFGQVIREYEQKAGAPLDAIYMSGGGALFPGTEKHLATALEREIRRADPFTKVAYPAFMEDVMQEVGPSFTVALGAALRSFE